jgi:hypothetical protein
MYWIHPRPAKLAEILLLGEGSDRDNRPGGLPVERQLMQTGVVARHTFPRIHKPAPEVTTVGQKFPNIYTLRSPSTTSVNILYTI